MHYFICIGLVALLLPASAYDIAPPSDIDRDYWKPFEVSVTFNTIYDKPSRSLNEVSCWREKGGLDEGHQEWLVQGDIHTPVIAIDAITGSNSVGCVTCWTLEYGVTSKPFLAVDRAESGFVTSLEGFNSLTNGRAEELGRINVTASQVDILNCDSYGPPRVEL